MLGRGGWRESERFDTSATQTFWQDVEAPHTGSNLSVGEMGRHSTIFYQAVQYFKCDPSDGATATCNVLNFTLIGGGYVSSVPITPSVVIYSVHGKCKFQEK
jgi:hypothetical protein